jgi:hypothetical protein
LCRSIYACGFAAAQCGKALPYREALFILLEATPPVEAAKPQGFQQLLIEVDPLSYADRLNSALMVRAGMHEVEASALRGSSVRNSCGTDKRREVPHPQFG